MKANMYRHSHLLLTVCQSGNRCKQT